MPSATADDGATNKLLNRLVWFAIGILFLLGIALAGVPGSPLLPLSSDPDLVALLKNVGYGLIGGALTATIFQFAAGASNARQAAQQRQMQSTLESLQSGIQKVPGIIAVEQQKAVAEQSAQIQQATAEQQRALSDQQAQIMGLSNLLATANSLGVVAIAGGREGASNQVFPDRMTLVERWKHLLRHAHQVDLLCWEDSKLLDYATVLGDDVLNGVVLRRLQNSEDLTLRILLSTQDNPCLDQVNDWIHRKNYMQDQIADAERYLHYSHITERFPEILRRHRELLAFTLLRGDSELYIVYFFPRHGAGPILQLAPSHTTSTSQDLFTAYTKYFGNLWDQYRPDSAG